MFDRSINLSIYSLAKLVEVLNSVVFRMVHWREDRCPDPEPIFSPDQAEDLEHTHISLRELNLGDFQIECPHCGERDDTFLVGLSLWQYDEEEHYDITTVGMLAFTCGEIIYSACLTDKVAGILNASDNYTLTFDMLTNLMVCEEHGVLHTEE